MKHTIIFLSFVLIGVCCFTQTPGYQGYKWAVYGSTGLSPAFNGDYLQDDLEDNSTHSRIGLNARFDVSTDYTLNKVVVAGGSFKHITTNIPYAYYTVALESPLSPFDAASYLGDIKLNANFGSFYLKFFPFERKGVIAPIGHYNKFEFIFGMVKGSTGGWSSDFYDPDIEAYHSNGETLILPEFEDLNYQLDERIMGFIYTFGNTWAFTDKLIFDFSTQFGWLIGSDFMSDIVPEGNSGDSEYYYEQDAINRLQGAFLMNFNFGVGYFLF